MEIFPPFKLLKKLWKLISFSHTNIAIKTFRNFLGNVLVFNGLFWDFFTGYLLADDPQGETPLIPSEVMEHSIKHSTEVDINTTLQLLGSPGEKATSIPGCNRTDSVVR